MENLKNQEDLLLENFKIEELEERLEMKHDWSSPATVGGDSGIYINGTQVYP